MSYPRRGVSGGPSHLLKLVGDHGKGLEDGVGGACDGHDSFWAVSLRDVDPRAALEGGHSGRGWSRGRKLYGASGPPTATSKPPAGPAAAPPAAPGNRGPDAGARPPREGGPPAAGGGLPGAPTRQDCRPRASPPPANRTPLSASQLTSSRIFFTVSPFWNRWRQEAEGQWRCAAGGQRLWRRSGRVGDACLGPQQQQPSPRG